MWGMLGPLKIIWATWLRVNIRDRGLWGDPRDEGNELEKGREVDAGCLGWFLDGGFRFDQAGLFLDKPKPSYRPLQPFPPLLPKSGRAQPPPCLIHAYHTI